MTIVLEQKENENYYISLEITKKWDNELYVVQCCPIIDKANKLCGYPQLERFYSINDKENAYKTFKRYVKKYI